jgi:hypothetical protein
VISERLYRHAERHMMQIANVLPDGGPASRNLIERLPATLGDLAKRAGPLRFPPRWECLARLNGVDGVGE